jgi:hypothetical protein
MSSKACTVNCDPPGVKAGLSQAHFGKAALTALTTLTSSKDKEESKDGEAPRTMIFHSQDFMKFLNQVDIANLMFETKDGERFKASFPGSSVTSSAIDDGQSKPIFKSLEMLKDYGMVYDEKTEADANVRQSTVALEYFPPNPISQDLEAPVAVPAATTGKSSSADAFVSREWAAEYQNSHVDVSYSSCFGGSKILGSELEPKLQNSIDVPPKQHAPSSVTETNGNDHWNAMFKRALAPLVDAASVAQQENQAVPATSMGDDVVMSNAQSSKKRPGRRKPRKIIPDVKTYCEFAEKVRLFIIVGSYMNIAYVLLRKLGATK